VTKFILIIIRKEWDFAWINIWIIFTSVFLCKNKIFDGRNYKKNIIKIELKENKILYTIFRNRVVGKNIVCFILKNYKFSIKDLEDNRVMKRSYRIRKAEN